MHAVQVWMAFLWMVLGLAPAHADEPAPTVPPAESPFRKAWDAAQPKPPAAIVQPTVFEAMDGQFGAWVVGPLATVMFFDVVFWDDTLAPGAGVGKISAGAGHVEVITSFDAQKGYGTQHGWVVPDVLPLPAAPVSARYGSVQASLEVIRTSDRPILMARIPAQPVDLAAFGLTPWDPASAESPVSVAMVPGLDFPVSVNRRTAEIEPTEGVAPDGAIPVEPGQTVWVAGQGERVVSGGSKGAWEVIDPEVHWSAAALPNPEQAKLPVVVLWLVLGAVFFTLRMSFVNLRAFGHAIAVTAGKYDDPDHPGEISHFQALSSALSATVGLGNIAGVAIAISLGGPGAIFWMWIAGFLGMSSKFVECTLGQMYRVRKPDGSVSGGPMHYLDKGLAELGLGAPGKVLAILFAVMCIGGSLGGGNMFQANQSLEAVAEVVPMFKDYAWVYGLLLMLGVGMVIIGGIKRIGAAAGVVVPVMCGVYVIAGLYVLVTHAADVPAAFGQIVGQAFVPEAGLGGMVGVLAIGFQRASFSNEAGVGSASIAHSAAATDEPVREGIVALLEPFIDTIIVCSVTALVVVVTGVKVPPGSGIKATMDAFATILPWFPLVLAFAAMMFAFSTMVSWSYYGESCSVWLLGEGARLPYRIVFLAAVFVGSVLKLGNVLDFSDLMILGMAFPNILGALLLSGKVKGALDTYWADLKAGRFDTEG